MTLEVGSLSDAKFVLFIDHCKGEIVESDIVLDEGVGTDYDVDTASGKRIFDALFLAGRCRPRQQLNPQSKGQQQLGKCLVMLLC